MQSSNAFMSHALWTTLQTIEDEGQYKDIEDISARHYLIALLEELTKKRDGVNPYFVPSESLDNLNSYLSSIRSYVPSNPTQITRYVDSAFAELSARWPAHNGRYVVDISKSTFDRIVGEMADDLEEARTYVDKVKDLEEKYETKASEVEQSLNSLKEETEATVSNIENDAETRLTALDEAYKQEAEEAKTTTAASLQEIKDEYIAKLIEKEKEAEGILKEVQNTSNAASGKVVADSYADYAAQKEKQTKRYDVWAIVFAVVGVAMVGFALVWLHADESSATVFKMTASVASFVVSGYLFRRGTFCQREAKAAKRTELTLKQYRSFIANLDDDEKKRITTEVAERIFIRGEIDDDAPTITEAFSKRGISEKELKSVLEIIKGVREIEQ